MGLYDRDYGRDEDSTPWDRHQRSQTPKSMVIILLIVTVAIYFLDLLTADRALGALPKSQLADWFACWKNTAIQPWFWYQFLSYGFLHDLESIFHVGFNMLGLFIFGRAIEQQLGRMEFLRFYLVSMFIGGVVGSLTYWVMGAPDGRYVIGASGAVIAVTILFACYFPNVEILLMMVLPVKAWVLAVVFVVSNLYGSLSMLTDAGAASQGGTAFTVHLAGVGFALLYFYQRWNLAWLDFTQVGHNVQRSIRNGLD